MMVEMLAELQMNVLFKRHVVMTRLEGMMTSPYEGVKQYPWIPDDATSEQKGLVEEVVTKLKNYPNIDYLENASGWVVDEKLAMKYAQALEWKNSSNVASMVLETMQWRVDYGVKDIDPREFESIALRCPFYILGRDNLGRPIIYVDVYRLKKEDPDYCLRYIVFTMERAAQVFKAEKGEQRVIIVVDCSGSRPAHEELYSEYLTPDGEMKGGMSATAAKMMAHIMSIYYRESNGCAIGSDAGFTVNTLYKAVKYVVPADTRKKVKFETFDETCKILLSMAPPENVVVQYGGKLELEYNAMAYLYRYDFKKALFVPIESGPPRTISSAFSSEITHEDKVPAGGTMDIFAPNNSIFYSAVDGYDMAKTTTAKQSVVDDEHGGGIHTGKCISINLNDSAELEARVAEMPHLQWMKWDFSIYQKEDEVAFHSAWERDTSPEPKDAVPVQDGSKSCLGCCMQ
eukprot:280469_1